MRHRAAHWSGQSNDPCNDQPGCVRALAPALSFASTSGPGQSPRYKTFAPRLHRRRQTAIDRSLLVFLPAAAAAPSSRELAGCVSSASTATSASGTDPCGNNEEGDEKCPARIGASCRDLVRVSVKWFFSGSAPGSCAACCFPLLRLSWSTKKALPRLKSLQ